MPAQSYATFLFEPENSKPARTARKVHIRRLFDVLELCIHRGDLQRARRAWAILVRCKELDWWEMWRTGILFAGEGAYPDDKTIADRLEYLQTIMLQHATSREPIFQELVLLLILSDQYEKALDELELYLPSPPYQENPVLHLYAGLICLYLTQPKQASEVHTIPRTLRDAEQYFERTKHLDPDDVVASAWLEKLPELAAASQNRVVLPESDDEDEDGDETMSDCETKSRAKRVKP